MQAIEITTNDNFKALVQEAEVIRRIIRSRSIIRPLESRSQLLEQLRFELFDASRWLSIRSKFQQIVSVVSASSHKVAQHFGYSGSLSVGHYGSNWNQGRCSSNTRQASQFQNDIPTMPELVSIHQQFQAWNKLCVELLELYNQCDELRIIGRSFYGGLRNNNAMTRELWQSWDYKPNGKAFMPVGGRSAWACILALRTGQKDDNKQDEHSLFGFTHSSDTWKDNCRRIARQLQDRPEKTGRAPSIRQGRELLGNHHPVVDKTGRYYRSPTGLDRSSIVQVIYSKMTEACSSGSRSDASCTLAMFARNNKDLCCRSSRLVRAIMGLKGEEADRNNVPTLFTGRPVNIGGDDYVVPLMASEVLYDQTRIRRSSGYRTLHGFGLLRSNWPDVIHVKLENVPACYGGTNGDDVQEVVNGLREKLDSASNYYFESRKTEKERKLSFRTRQARIVKQLRGLEIICRTDSYAAGNCTPGTTVFMSQIGIGTNTECVSGRELAYRWHKAGYVSLDRLAAIIPHCLKSRQSRIDSALSALLNPYDGKQAFQEASQCVLS